MLLCVHAYAATHTHIGVHCCTRTKKKARGAVQVEDLSLLVIFEFVQAPLFIRHPCFRRLHELEFDTIPLVWVCVRVLGGGAGDVCDVRILTREQQQQ